MTITNWNGSHLDGILLNSEGLKLRVAIAGRDDAAEFHLHGGCWFSEDYQPVEIQFHHDMSEPEPFTPGKTAAGRPQAWAN
jgi:hypothetical protein